MPGTSRKSVKRRTSPQTPQRKLSKPLQKRKSASPRIHKKGPRNGQKKRKPSDMWQAALLTATLVISAVIISIGIINIQQHRTRQVDGTSVPAMALPEIPVTEEAVPEALPVQDKPPAREAVLSPHTTAKAPAQAPQNRQAAKIPAARTPAPEPAAVPKQTPIVSTVKPAAIPEPAPKPQHQGTLVFIIDDAGNNLQELEPFLRFPGPLTIAVLPGLPHSAEAARRIRAAGKEVFLHQPMEAVGGQAPGPGAIYAGMTAAEVEALLRRNVAEIGPIAGMNNHQGSKITADQQIMETVLAFCLEQGIYFLDSRTTAETAVPAAARNVGVKIGERNIFIDNEQTRASMNHYIESGLAVASQKGSAVMIGHTWSPELAPLLAELYQNLVAQGYTFATATSLIK